MSISGDQIQKVHGYLKAFERRILDLENHKNTQLKQIEGLKKVCKLQQQFTDNWEQEVAELKNRQSKANDYFKSLSQKVKT